MIIIIVIIIIVIIIDEIWLPVLCRLYKGLKPLWGRQIPYTMMKFACFENTVEALYKYVVPKPKSQCSKTEQLTVSFAAGYIAGIFCAVVSQPADNLVSKLNSQPGATAGCESYHIPSVPHSDLSWLNLSLNRVLDPFYLLTKLNGYDPWYELDCRLDHILCSTYQYCAQLHNSNYKVQCIEAVTTLAHQRLDRRLLKEWTLSFCNVGKLYSGMNMRSKMTMVHPFPELCEFKKLN